MRASPPSMPRQLERERWTGAYDALVDAAAATLREPGCTVALTDLHRFLDAFSESCDRAEGLVQEAAAGLGPAASRDDELCRAVRAVDKELWAAAAGREENGWKRRRIVLRPRHWQPRTEAQLIYLVSC
ncbi:hypothetical protein ACQJBY_009387 [Aegilops geniculata]